VTPRVVAAGLVSRHGAVSAWAKCRGRMLRHLYTRPAFRGSVTNDDIRLWLWWHAVGVSVQRIGRAESWQ
jgi:hypothetical protein